jgi:hypothetical protein
VAAWAAPRGASADRRQALEAGERGRRALAARQWDEATDAFFEAALADPSWLPALAGLGEAALGAGRTGEGLEHLRRFVDLAEADPRAAAPWADDLSRVRKVLKQRDREGARLERIVDDHVAALAKLARSRADDDLALARAAFREGAALRPGDPAWDALAWPLGLLPAGDPLFDGQGASGWTWFEAPAWSVAEGEIRGRAADVWAACRTTVRLAGDFDVRCEARVVDGGRGAVFFLQGAWSAYDQNVSLGMTGRGVLLIEGSKLPKDADPPSDKPVRTKTRFDAEQWNLFELRFRPREVEAWVSGERVGSVRRLEAYESGHVALAVLQGTVAFRRLEVVHGGAPGAPAR